MRKSKLLHSVTSSFNREYHFIIKNGCIEMWVGKFSACYDTGHRFNLIVGYQKDYQKYFNRVVETMDDQFCW